MERNGGRPKNKTNGFQNNEKNKNQNKTNGFQNDEKNKNQNETETKPNVNVNDNVNVNVNDNANVNGLGFSSAAIEFWNNNIGQLTPYELQKLESYLDDFSEDVIILAMKKAVEKKVRTLSYVEGILRSWKAKELFNLVDIENEAKDSGEVSDEELFNSRLKLLEGVGNGKS